ncbi:amidohydrolase family protein [Marinilongibacter aquaticus]|uniref:amidohydrolase family protein n=1 Tax=Marinilongibacter aquaticus TaxID=2975157 RepID=UPI0021BD4504|nr:amidohydrolase family protein [Marinilongibacter aquaticus]UBM57468.1 amidohydrolase family protein [Marinilongibacter aquaticus]
MKRYLVYIISVAFAGQALAQNPAPGKVQDHPILIENGEIHVGNGQVFEGDILFENGQISKVAEHLENVPKDAERINATGKRVYPGIISPFSTVGLNETSSLRPTHDYNEMGEMNPSVRALIAYNTDSEVIPTVRGNGVLIGQTAPLGGLVSGRSSIMNYDGWNWEDAVLRADDGLWINWPRVFVDTYKKDLGKRVHEKSEKYEEQVETLRLLFEEAKAYLEGANALSNQNLGALQGVYSGDTKVYVVANSAKQIVAAMAFFREMKIGNVVLVGGREALLVKDLLKKYEIPVLVEGTHRLPESTDQDVWAPYKLPAELKKAGLKVGLYYNDEFWRSRNLPFVAGTTAAFGLEKEEALQMITLSNAEILGIADKVGSLEAGKQATLFISSGDALDMRTARVERAFIQGREVNLDDKQKRLYHKYEQKYGIE